MEKEISEKLQINDLKLTLQIYQGLIRVKLRPELMNILKLRLSLIMMLIVKQLLPITVLPNV